MALDARLKPNEVLAVAIRSEIDAADFYGGILARVQNILLRQKLEFLVLEEKKHRKILERLHAERYPETGLDITGQAVRPRPVAKVGETSSVLDLFKVALEAEKIAEEYYREARTKMDDAGSRKILEYLSRVERSHYFMVRSEIDLLSRFPDYYDVEDFHLGQDLFHVGP
jgi:rubrerythrin